MRTKNSVYVASNIRDNNILIAGSKTKAAVRG